MRWPFDWTMVVAPMEFTDLLPVMAEKLGMEGLMEELCNGFRLLMDEERGVITFDSLKRNAARVLGLDGIGDEELREMMREGDTNGDGVLNQMDFCVLMFRISPWLMEESWRALGEAMADQHQSL